MWHLIFQLVSLRFLNQIPLKNWLFPNIEILKVSFEVHHLGVQVLIIGWLLRSVTIWYFIVRVLGWLLRKLRDKTTAYCWHCVRSSHAIELFEGWWKVRQYIRLFRKRRLCWVLLRNTLDKWSTLKIVLISAWTSTMSFVQYLSQCKPAAVSSAHFLIYLVSLKFWRGYLWQWWSRIVRSNRVLGLYRGITFLNW